MREPDSPAARPSTIQSASIDVDVRTSEMEIMRMLLFYERRRRRALEEGRFEDVTTAEQSLREALRVLGQGRN